MTTETPTHNEPDNKNHAAQDEALAAYQNGDYATALAAWQPLADAGDAQAQFNLAIMYHNGQGTEPDAAKAIAYCTLAADNDIPPAQHYRGYLLMDEEIGTPNPEKAAHYWQRAAEHGIDDAQYQLGSLYVQGSGVSQDTDTAADWFEAAALQGHAPAQYNLGVLYANAGQYTHARHWWNKAQAQNNPDAQAALAKLDEMGL